MLVRLYYLDWNVLHGLSGADCDGLGGGGGPGKNTLPNNFLVEKTIIVSILVFKIQFFVAKSLFNGDIFKSRLSL